MWKVSVYRCYKCGKAGGKWGKCKVILFPRKNDKIQTVILTLYKNQYVKHSNFTN